MLLLLGRLITESKIAPAVKTLFDSRVKSCFSQGVNSVGFFVQINESLYKYNLNTYFEDWHANSIFLSYNGWKYSWHNYCENHPLNLTNSCLSNISPSQTYTVYLSWPSKAFPTTGKLLVPWTKNHLSSFKCGFLNIFSRQNLLGCL